MTSPLFDLIYHIIFMGGNQPQSKGKEKSYEAEDTSFFFYKQMVTSSEILGIEQHYTLQQKIGEGTYATVFRGKSVRSKCTCCIKRVDKSKSPGLKQTLDNEFDILRDMDHPNIIKLYSFLEDQKYFYVVTELIKGEQLFSYFKEQKRIEESQAFGIFHQVALCLNHLHLNKIMHRDIKLENMIYNPKTRLIKLIDFGSALKFTESVAKKVVGTASYIAPEVINKDYNQMCDVWSLGVFLHLMLTGTAPFQGKSQEQLFERIKNDHPSMAHPIYDKVPNAKDLVSKLLIKNPKQRIKLSEVLAHPWVQDHKRNMILSPSDHECMLNIFTNMRKFSFLKIADFQLGVLVFLINFIVEYQNQDAIIRCFHLIDSEGDGVVTENQLAEALIDYEDRPKKKAIEEATRIMNKIDFNQSKDINYSQFLAASTPLSKIITDSNLESAFRMLDSDGSGKLSAKELKDHLGGQVSQEYYKTILSFFDMDRDGEISLHEFKEMMKKLAY